jgi:hypothetical protein
MRRKDRIKPAPNFKFAESVDGHRLEDSDVQSWALAAVPLSTEPFWTQCPLLMSAKGGWGPKYCYFAGTSLAKVEEHPEESRLSWVTCTPFASLFSKFARYDLLPRASYPALPNVWTENSTAGIFKAVLRSAPSQRAQPDSLRLSRSANVTSESRRKIRETT